MDQQNLDLASLEEQRSIPVLGPGNRGARMVTYEASENDTKGEENECVICFEEFDIGDIVARLECFCRYHKVRFHLL